MTRPTLVWPSGHTISVSQAAELINDAINPDADRELGLRAILNELLMLVHGRQLVARVPASLAPVPPDSVTPFEMAQCVVLSEDLKPILDDKRIAYVCRGAEVRSDLLPHVAESPVDRAKRRIARLREMGGDFDFVDGKWITDGPRGVLSRLVKEEKAANHPMRDRSDVRKELQRAVEMERKGLFP